MKKHNSFKHSINYKATICLKIQNIRHNKEIMNKRDNQIIEGSFQFSQFK